MKLFTRVTSGVAVAAAAVLGVGLLGVSPGVGASFSDQGTATAGISVAKSFDNAKPHTLVAEANSCTAMLPALKNGKPLPKKAPEPTEKDGTTGLLDVVLTLDPADHDGPDTNGPKGAKGAKKSGGHDDTVSVKGTIDLSGEQAQAWTAPKAWKLSDPLSWTAIATYATKHSLIVHGCEADKDADKVTVEKEGLGKEQQGKGKEGLGKEQQGKGKQDNGETGGNGSNGNTDNGESTGDDSGTGDDNDTGNDNGNDNGNDTDNDNDTGSTSSGSSSGDGSGDGGSTP